MAFKYYRYTLEGNVDPQQAGRVLGDALSDGVVVRVDSREGKTDVTVARSSEAKKDDRGVEVSEEDLQNVSGK